MRLRLALGLLVAAATASPYARAVVPENCPASLGYQWVEEQLSPDGISILDAAETSAGSFIQAGSTLLFKAAGAATFVTYDTDVLAIQPGSRSGLVYSKWDPYSQSHQLWRYESSSTKVPYPQLAGGIRWLAVFDPTRLVFVVDNSGFNWNLLFGKWSKPVYQPMFDEIEIDQTYPVLFGLERGSADTPRRVYQDTGILGYRVSTDYAGTQVYATQLGRCAGPVDQICFQYAYQDTGTIYAWAGVLVAGDTYNVYQTPAGIRQLVNIAMDPDNHWLGTYVNGLGTWQRFHCDRRAN